MLNLRIKKHVLPKILISIIGISYGSCYGAEDPVRAKAQEMGMTLLQFNEYQNRIKEEKIREYEKKTILKHQNAAGHLDMYYSLEDISYAGQIRDQIFRRENSSGMDANCLLYSITRDDKDLLTKILGDAYIAQQILELPESPNELVENRRSLSLVRQTIFTHIKEKLDTQFPTPEKKSMSLRHYLDKEIRQQNMPGYQANQAITVEEALDHIFKNDLLLDNAFAIVISLLYDRPIHVLHPVSPTSRQLSPMNPVEFVMPKGNVIFVFHNHGHFEKLIPINENAPDEMTLNHPIHKDIIVPTDFNGLFYINLYHDLTLDTHHMDPNGKNQYGINHYKGWGFNEKRPYLIPADFNGFNYVNMHPDLTKDVVNQSPEQIQQYGYNHYVGYGHREGRQYKPGSDYRPGLKYIRK